jgi:hypothetical protein
MRSVSLIPIVFLLASCEAAPLYFKVTGAGAGLIAEVYKKWWIGLRSSETPCVHDVTLTRNSDVKVLWRTTVDTARQCNDLKIFMIGRAPRGFRDAVRLSGALSAGDYTLTTARTSSRCR